MAFCHEMKMNWGANGVLPRAKIELANEWRFTTNGKRADEQMAFHHERKSSWRTRSGLNKSSSLRATDFVRAKQSIFHKNANLTIQRKRFL